MSSQAAHLNIGRKVMKRALAPNILNFEEVVEVHWPQIFYFVLGWVHDRDEAADSICVALRRRDGIVGNSEDNEGDRRRHQSASLSRDPIFAQKPFIATGSRGEARQCRTSPGFRPRCGSVFPFPSRIARRVT